MVASSSQGATPWDLSGDFTCEDVEWVAEHMNDMAPRFDDYEFWTIHEAISDEAQSRGNDLRDQGVYEEEDVDQAFPREFVGLWQGICLGILENPAPLDQEGPDRSDLFFVLPKLVLGRPQRAESRKERLERLNQQFQLASQGEWDTLLQRWPGQTHAERWTTSTHWPPQRMDYPHTLPSAFTDHGQLGKAWRQLRALPPLPAGIPQWEAAREKLFPHGSREGRPRLRDESTPHLWQPTMPQFTKAVRRLKRQKAEGGPPKRLRAAWRTPVPNKRSCSGSLARPAPSHRMQAGKAWSKVYHRLFCLDKGGGGVRPILIGMIWTKILSHLLLARARPDLDIHLKERQLGIGTSQGGLAMTISIMARLQETQTMC